MHRFSSRSDESADLSALRHARGYPLAGHAGGAARGMTSSLRSDEGGGGAGENLCKVRAKQIERHGLTDIAIYAVPLLQSDESSRG